MAKSKASDIPTIRSNSSLMSWLNKETESGASSSPTDKDSSAEAEAATQSPEVSDPLETSLASEPQPALNEKVVDEASKGKAFDVENAPGRPVVSAVVAPRKGKSKTESNSSGQTYSELFFKKPVKPEQGEAGTESKPIRISEDSHWLLSVLVESARRLGNKLTVGDLIENLLAEHRKVHKEDVDEWINQWKTRKKIS